MATYSKITVEEKILLKVNKVFRKEGPQRKSNQQGVIQIIKKNSVSDPHSVLPLYLWKC